jgi:hypothetical protein
MWEFLIHLPPALSFSIIALALFGIVLVILRGRFKAKLGDKSLDVGNDGLREISSAMTLPPPTTMIPRGQLLPVATTPPPTPKRSCGDCVLLLFGEREKLELNIRKERDKILKSQMTFAEQKLIETQNILLNAMASMIHSSVKANNSQVDEAVQYKLSYGLLRDTLSSVKDEIRRSFKAGEFYEMNGAEFAMFIKERASTLIFMMTAYIRNIFPDRGNVVNATEIITAIEDKALNIGNIVSEIYTHARDTKIEIDRRICNLKTEFGQWVDNFTL